MKRTATDVWAFVLYIVMLFIYTVCVVIAIRNGQPSHFIAPVSSKGEFCGVDDPTKPNLLIMDYKSIQIVHSFLSIFLNRRLIINSKSMCYGKCPTYSGIPTLAEHVCLPEVTITDLDSLQNAIKNQQCMKHNYPTYQLFNYCVIDMKILKSSTITISELMSSFDVQSFVDFFSSSPLLFTQISIVDEALRELSKIKYSLILYGFICLFSSMITLVLLGYKIYPILIGLFVVTLTISIIGLVITSLIPYTLDSIKDSSETVSLIVQRMDSIMKGQHKFFCFLLITCFVILVLIHIFFGICFRKAVKRAGEYAKQAGRASVVLVFNAFIPFVKLIMQTALICLMFYVIICIMTAKNNNTKYFRIGADGYIKFEEVCDMQNKDPKYQCAFGGISIDALWSLILINIAIFTIWTVCLIQGTSTYIISYTYYKYYVHGKNKICSDFFYNFMRGITRLFMYNIGSIIIGAIIISILSIFHIVIKVIKSALGLSEDTRNRAFPKYVRTIFDFFEQVVGQVSKQTYIEIAVAKKKFYTSVKEPIKIVRKDIKLTLAVNLFCSTFLFVGSVVTSAITSVCSYLHIAYYLKNIDHPFYLSVIVFMLSLFVSQAILSVYTIGIMTLYSYDYHKNGEVGNVAKMEEDEKLDVEVE